MKDSALDVQNSPLFLAFCDRIKNPLAAESLKISTPWVYWTMEMYSPDIKGFGGLGMLAGDTRAAARALEIPMVFITGLYPRESHQRLVGFEPQSDIIFVNFEDRGFVKEGTVEISTRDQRSSVTELEVYTKKEGSVIVIGITEPNFGLLYQGGNSEWHRLYQDVAVGFGGYKVLKERGLEASVHQLNEAPTVFGVLAALDDHYGMIKKRIDEEEKVLSEEHGLTDEEREALALGEALDSIRRKTIYTNHTLIQAVESEFDTAQFEHFVIPNLKHEAIQKWARTRIGEDGKLKLSVLALSKQKNLELSAQDCFDKIFQALQEINEKFFMHTDNHADPSDPFSIGCGHAAKPMNEQLAPAYHLNPDDEKALVAYAKEQAEKNPGQIVMVNLPGNHEEQAVLIVESNNFSLNNFDEKTMFFLYDKSRDIDFVKTLVPLLNIPEISIDEFQKMLDDQTSATLHNLALGKPIYEVNIKNSAEFDMKFLDTVK